MNAIKTAQCNRCGSNNVAWVKSKKTGRNYLAFAVQASYRCDGAIYPQTPHDCTNPTRGGYQACPICGKHHHISAFGTQPSPADCAKYPAAK